MHSKTDKILIDIFFGKSTRMISKKNMETQSIKISIDPSMYFQDKDALLEFIAELTLLFEKFIGYDVVFTPFINTMDPTSTNEWITDDDLRVKLFDDVNSILDNKDKSKKIMKLFKDFINNYTGV